MIIKITLFCSLFILSQCVSDDNKTLTINMNNGSTKKIQADYYKTNIEESTHFDSIDFRWTADDLLEDNYNIQSIGNYGQSILFSPVKSGSHKITLNIYHKWTGEILSSEYYLINSRNAESNQYSSSELDTKDSKEIIPSKQSQKIEESSFKKPSYRQKDKKKITSDKEYCVQVSSWENKKDAILESKRLKALGYKTTTETFNKKNKDWWRVRIGCYNKRQDASKLSNKFYKDFSITPWIDVRIKKGSNQKIVQPDNSNIQQRKKIEVENLINYEDINEKKKPIEIENLINYENINEKKKPIEVENLINYENINEKIIKEEYYIQVSTWPSKESAEEDLKVLEKFNYTGFILESSDQRQRTWYKVRIGPLNSEQKAIELKYKVSNDLERDVWVDKK